MSRSPGQNRTDRQGVQTQPLDTSLTTAQGWSHWAQYSSPEAGRAHPKQHISQDLKWVWEPGGRQVPVLLSAALPGTWLWAWTGHLGLSFSKDPKHEPELNLWTCLKEDGEEGSALPQSPLPQQPLSQVVRPGRH